MRSTQCPPDARTGQMLIENKSKFVLVHASSGHKRAVEDILSQPTVQSRLADTKAAEEIRALKTFFDMLKKDPERAYYGYNVSDVYFCPPSLCVVLVCPSLVRFMCHFFCIFGAESCVP